VEVVREAVELMAPVAARKQVVIEVHFSGEREDVLCDRNRIEPVLQNLVDNAIHFTPAHGRIAVRVDRTGEEVSVAVADGGPGIPREQRDQVFERYWRGRGASRQGVGLGLFIVKSLIDAHGGRISVEDAPGGGATFVFILPAAVDAGEAATHQTRVAGSHVAAGPP
jgi:signal transduction histidine kinase